MHVRFISVLHRLGFSRSDRPGQLSVAERPAPSTADHRSVAEKEDLDMQYRPQRLPALVVATGALLSLPVAHADNDNNTLVPNNKRLNDGVVANVFTVQHQAGCTNDVRISPQLQAAAQRHTQDVLNNRALDGDIGSDGSSPQDRANAAGFHGPVAETVAINQSIAISGNDLINRWYYNPDYFKIMSNCANSQMGVWSLNSPDRTVVVAVYGQPQAAARGQGGGATPLNTDGQNIPLDPSPDYDASDELEFGLNWFPWILRGVYPPPGNPPQ
ncbi:hypothetical protein MINTM018_13570 [Mycobacterium intracellulare]|uniref:SCP domain-containing protein n=2 Tax=Mycobacterium intracellulare TaxID=1767 RepID=A0A7R7MTU8_MYCIT|nr:hypothetical protein MINTM018_13570 [Mycobacterium intracellulare]